MIKLLLWLLAASTATARTSLRGEAQQRPSHRELAVSELWLIDAENDAPILPLTDGAVLSTDALPTTSLNIEAVLSSPASSVTFGFNNSDNFRTEGKAPYALCGDKGGDFNSCDELTIGTHTVTATPEGGAPFTIMFSIVEGEGTPVTSPTDAPVMSPTDAPVMSPTDAPVTSPTDAPVTSLTDAPVTSPTDAPVVPAPVPSPPTPAPSSDVTYVLVDAETDADLAVLSQSEITTVNAMSSSMTFNVRLEGNQGVVVTSVDFDGGKNEGKEPFSYCGDSGGDYKVCPDLVEGQHTITSTAAISGKPDLTTSVTFILVLSGPTAPTTPAPVTTPTTPAPVTMPTTPAPVTTPTTPAPVTMPTTPAPVTTPTTPAPVPLPPPTPTGPIGNLPTAAAAAFEDPIVQTLLSLGDTYSSAEKGKAELTITEGSNNVEKSNFGDNSFVLQNTGDKRIAACFIDASDSMFSDSVFDNDGTGGDSTAKDLNYDSGGNTVGAVSIDNYPYLWLPARDNSFDGSANFDPNNLQDENNLFVDETANTNKGSPKAGGGFRGELLLFDDFDAGEQCGFSGDMDPNSIAGLSKGSVDSGANWDVGGVSGAEMIAGVVSILFADGSTASSTLASDGSNAGSIAVLDEDGLQAAPFLEVNNIGPGGSGTYNNNPDVRVAASGGSKVRVSMAKGFDAVVNNQNVAGGAISINDLVAARLAVQYPEFPVNNAESWQHEEVTIPSSGSLDVSDMFDVGNDNLPIAWSAVIIDNGGDPLSETTKPIRLIPA